MEMDRFRFLIMTLIAFLVMGNSVNAQEINERVWSITYWQKLAKQGLIEVTPADTLYRQAPRKYDSRIYASMVFTDDSPDIPVTTQTNVTQSENSIFINPNDDQKILNSNNSSDLPISQIFGASYWVSDDGGQTWTGSEQGAGGSNSGDPAAAIDLSGRYYIGFIANNDGQGVAYSNNEGQTWTQVQIANPSGDLLDKNHMWVDNSPSSPFEGNLYSAWTDFGSTNIDIMLSRSTNSGLTWSTPVNVSNGLALDFNQGVNIQTGPNGEVYAAWVIYDAFPQDDKAIGFARSLDGGVTWSTPIRAINNIRGIRSTGLGGGKTMRVNSFPSMTVNQNDGTIYITWTNIGVPGVNSGDPDIYMIMSSDGGSTWSSSIRVNQDLPIGNGKDQWFPWIACDPSSGFLVCIFYDSRNFPNNDQAETFVAASTNGGNTWEDFKVSDVSWSGDGFPGFSSNYAGDYLGIDILNGKVYPAWSDVRGGQLMAWVSPFLLADPTDPNPPSHVDAYSDYTTPTSMALIWTDPTNLANGDTLLTSDFQIHILRDNVPLDSVDGGTEQYYDTGLSDGVLYNYTLFAKMLTNDSTSLGINVSWHAGGSPIPAPPDNLILTTDTVQTVLDWGDPTTQEDGTPLDDLDSLLVYRNGVHIFSLSPGVETYIDAPPPGFVYTYIVMAKDNETPPNLSGPSNEASGFVGTTPNMLVWVGPGAVGVGAASGDSLYEALVANGESTFLTNNLFEFGLDLSIYEAVFIVLGIYSNNHVLGASDPEAAALETYLQNSGRVFLEGGDCFNWDPESEGGYNIRPWFDLDDGSDGTADVSGVTGLNDLSAFSFTYSGENSYMDELQPFNSTPVWQNSSNTDISGVFNVYGSARTIGAVPSFGGFDNSSAALNTEPRIVKRSSKMAVEDIPKVRSHRENNEDFVKKAAYYPELKKNRKSALEHFEITTDGIHILANNKVDLMAAYLAYFRAGSGSPVIALSDTVFNDTLLVNDTATETLTITNNSGTLGGDLTYGIAENPEVTWLSVMPVAGTLTANQSEDITLSIDASGLTVGDYATTLDITSNDPTNLLVNVTVNLNVDDVPSIRIEPDSIVMKVAPDESDSTTFTIYNDGLGPLQILMMEDEEISATARINPAYVQEQKPTVYYAKGEEPPSNGGEMSSGEGGPDPFGYRWIDSDEPGGPSYIFTDISGTGNMVTLQPTGTFNPRDEGQAPINLPWDVKFYGNSYNQLQVNSNGFITFDMNFFTNAFTNQGIPNAAAPNFMVCALWDDLDGSSAGDIYYEQVGNKFIVQWSNWGYYPSGTQNMDFQIVLFQNSSTIWLAYQNVTDQGEATFGIENSTGAIGLQIAFNQAYAHNQLLAKISKGADWLEQELTNTTIAAGDSLPIKLRADAAGLSLGSYFAKIVITSNDPLNETMNLPIVTLNVTNDMPQIGTFPDSITFGNVLTGSDSTIAFTVQNVGTDTLEIYNIFSTNNSFTPDTSAFILLPAESSIVNLTFTPSEPGFYEGFVRVISNDPLHGTVSIYMNGYGLLENNPSISVTPDTIFFDTTMVGSNSSVPFTVQNFGTDTLKVFNINSTDPEFAADISAFQLPLFGEQTVNATFSPLSDGSFSGFIRIVSNDPATDTLDIYAKGYGKGNPVISITPDSIIFDSTEIGTFSVITFTVENIGNDTLEVFDMLISDSAFTVDTTSFKVDPSSSQEVKVTFTPTSPGQYDGLIRCISNDPLNDTLDIALSGYGEPPVGIADPLGLPTSYDVSPNYPNPFNPTTTIKYQLLKTSDVRLNIYNILGQRVRTLVSTRVEAGYHSTMWDGRNDVGLQLASGIYIYRFSADKYLKVQKMILMK